MAQYNVISAYFSHKSRLERAKLATPLMAMIIMMMMTMFRTKKKNLSSQNGHNTIKTLLKATYFNGSARESRGKSIECVYQLEAGIRFGQAEYIFGKQKFVLYVRQKVYDKSLEYFRQFFFCSHSRRVMSSLCVVNG